MGAARATSQRSAPAVAGADSVPVFVVTADPPSACAPAGSASDASGSRKHTHGAPAAAPGGAGSAQRHRSLRTVHYIVPERDGGTGGRGAGPAGRCILYVDCDRFYFAVEAIERPGLAADPRPVIIGRDPRAFPRGTVSTANDAARARGVQSGMNCMAVLRLAPDALFLPPRHAVYARYSQRVMAVLREASPLVQQSSIDEGGLRLAGGLRPGAGARPAGARPVPDGDLRLPRPWPPRAWWPRWRARWPKRLPGARLRRAAGDGGRLPRSAARAGHIRVGSWAEGRGRA